MIKSFVADVQCYLDERGELGSMPAPAVSIALFFGAIVSWVSGWPGSDGERTNVACRRGRDRPPCYGEVYARLAATGEIEWRCRTCGEQGTNSEWQGTRWDRSAE